MWSQPCVAAQAATTEAARQHALLAELRAPANNDEMPAAVSPKLGAWKDSLEALTAAVFACASPEATASSVEKSLNESLRGGVTVSPKGRGSNHGRAARETGPYGAEPVVQLFELSDQPRIVEVDFRYGMACGDDHLLLIFELAGKDAGWKERLRWDARSYGAPGNAFGDFILLTPLTGNPNRPQWRYVVAHGSPSCAEEAHPSTFSLDLLRPTGEPAKPAVDWHFEHVYQTGVGTPRLSTTEDTIDFRFAGEANGSTAGAGGGEYRFKLDRQQQVVPVTR